jgi:hypothetical protein
LLLLALASGADAHPSIENSLRVIVARDRVTLEANVSLDEVDIAHEIPSAGGPNIDIAKLGDVLKTHADYLLNHFDVRADDKPLAGKVARSCRRRLVRKVFPGRSWNRRGRRSCWNTRCRRRCQRRSSSRTPCWRSTGDWANRGQ